MNAALFVIVVLLLLGIAGWLSGKGPAERSLVRSLEKNPLPEPPGIAPEEPELSCLSDATIAQYMGMQLQGVLHGRWGSHKGRLFGVGPHDKIIEDARRMKINDEMVREWAERHGRFPEPGEVIHRERIVSKRERRMERQKCRACGLFFRRKSRR